MSEVVNLRTARKQRLRIEKRAEAAGRAAKGGEARVVRERREAEAALEKRRLDGARREPPAEE